MLLSPAKSLVEGPAVDGVDATEPTLLDETARLVEKARGLSAKKLQALMSISPALAEKNRERFQAMSLPLSLSRDNGRQAILMFDGDVYQGLEARTLDLDGLRWAQDRVAILSGLYGVLRPLDLAQPYRLEMGSKLRTRRGPDLYRFWGNRVTEQINAWLAERGDDTVVNLASHEYFSVLDPAKLKARVITPSFLDVKDGKARTLAFFAKRARGAMVRHAIDHRLESAEGLKESRVMDYRFHAASSTDTRWSFQRPQPPPVT